MHVKRGRRRVPDLWQAYAGVAKSFDLLFYNFSEPTDKTGSFPLQWNDSNDEKFWYVCISASKTAERTASFVTIYGEALDITSFELILSSDIRASV